MKISKTTSIAVTLCLSSLLFCNAAQSAPTTTSAVNTAKTVLSAVYDAPLHAVVQSLAAAASAGDATRMSTLFTLDGTYIDEDGVQTTGRAALQQRFAAGLASQGKIRTTATVQSIKRVAINTAFLEGTTCKESTNGPEACARFTMLLQKKNNEWLIASATETEIITQNAPQKVDRLASLSWLIGTWSASAGNAKVTMTADWVANKNFILCKFVIERPGLRPKVDVQIIGFDPSKQSIVSWNFDSSGGFGNGVWNKQGKEWQIRSTGMEQVGAQTGATNIIAVDSDNKFSWRSIDRVFDGKAVPNTEPLIVERVGRVIQ
ncbi:MAG: SgcJ/EcaC family oxidoreductase [Candidatus Obscuribacterales bacterium]|nr:SgcJ/EcaC family oxidoreductase [Candidatus Obscuribacterales bacterium]